jgi:hypothetical protein
MFYKHDGFRGEAVQATSDGSKSARIVEIDGVRGYLVLMMYLIHLVGLHDTVLGYLHHGRYSAVYDGEFFVLLSGFICAYAYHRASMAGPRRIWGKIINRVGWLWLYQTAAIVSVFGLFWLGLDSPRSSTGQAGAGVDVQAVIKAIALVDPPEFIGVLPLYISLMLFIPFAFYLLRSGRTPLFFGLLAGAWLCARYGADARFVDWLRSVVGDWSAHIRFQGYFNPLSWGVLFFGGFYLGYQLKTGGAERFTARVLPLNLAAFAAAVAAILAFALCSLAVAAGWDVPKHVLQPDRETLSLAGIINTAALAYALYFVACQRARVGILAQAGAALSRLFRLPWLVFIGRNSLFAYAVHVPIVYLVSHLIVSGNLDGRQFAVGALILTGGTVLWALTAVKHRYVPSLP